MCPDREMLAHRFHADLRVYAAAANSLVQAVGSNFSEALRRANRAHLVFEHARDQLNKHIRDHGCSKSTPIARTDTKKMGDARDVARRPEKLKE